MATDPTSEAEVEPSEQTAEPEVDRAAMLRALRELEAAKVRVERDAWQVHHEMRAKLVGELLPVLDNLDRTIEAATRSGDAPAIVAGVRMVRAQLEGVLERYGVERIDAVGEHFDPRIHEAVSMVAVHDPHTNRVVVEQIQPGYRLSDKLLRPAKVVVGRHAPRYH
jgi:molecular chaperone GrpE